MQIPNLIFSDNQHCLGRSNGSITPPPKDNAGVLLPFELIYTICEHSSHSTLKALRLTSKICQPSAEKFLFAVIYLKFDQDSFERLRNIAGHPMLSRLVHYVHYDSRQLELHRDLSDIDVYLSEHFTNYWRMANEQRFVNGTASGLEFDEAVTEFHEFRSKYVAYVDSVSLLI
jgi:hypothetical protein